MKTTILTNKNSWVYPYILQYIKGTQIKVRFNHEDIKKGDVLIILSYEKIISQSILKHNKHNLVVHSSDLPHGKGWSPIAWQILEGKESYINTLFEATEKADAGDIYFQDEVKLDGTELIDEIRKKDIESTFRLIEGFLAKPDLKGIKQIGQESFYKKRTREEC